MTIEAIISVLALMASMGSFFEWRIRVMQAQMKEKLADRDAINQVIQNELRGDVARLEAKIDMLIQLQIKDSNNASQ